MPSARDAYAVPHVDEEGLSETLFDTLKNITKSLEYFHEINKLQACARVTDHVTRLAELGEQFREQVTEMRATCESLSIFCGVNISHMNCLMNRKVIGAALQKNLMSLERRGQQTEKQLKNTSDELAKIASELNSMPPPSSPWWEGILLVRIVIWFMRLIQISTCVRQPVQEPENIDSIRETCHLLQALLQKCCANYQKVLRRIEKEATFNLGYEIPPPSGTADTHVHTWTELKNSLSKFAEELRLRLCDAQPATIKLEEDLKSEDLIDTICNYSLWGLSISKFPFVCETAHKLVDYVSQLYQA